MDSANVEKLKGAEKSTSLLLPTHNDNRPTKAEDENKMFKIQHFFLTLFLVTLLTLSLVSAASNNARQPAALAVSEEEAKFQDLLNSVEPGCLHEVLHQFMGAKYKHGVYQEDKTAMEVLHQSNAEVAHSLIELAKREGGTSSSNGSATTTTVPDSTTTTLVPVAPTTPPTILPPSSSTTVPVPVPPISSTPQTTPQSASSTTTVIETSTASPSGSTTAPTSTPSSTTGSTSSTRSSDSESSLTTSRSITQQVVYTTTGANGAQETVTRTTIVPAVQAETGGSDGTGTNTATASLQSNGVSSDKGIGLNLVLGVLGLIVAGAL